MASLADFAARVPTPIETTLAKPITLELSMACRLHERRTATSRSFIALFLPGVLVLWGCDDSDSLPRAATLDRPAVDRGRPADGPGDSPQRPKRDAAIPELRGVLFADAAAQRDLHYAWPQQRRPMRTPDAFGSGCAAFDADDDGWQDVLLVGAPRPALFRNVDGRRFENVTDRSGLSAVEGDWTGCAIGDFDGDGRLDILLTGIHRLALYRNLGALRFQLVTEEGGLDGTNRGHWGASAGFMDLDGDGWLDLVIVNYVVFGPDSRQYCEYPTGARAGCRPQVYPPEFGEIWRNTGRGGFEPVPGSAGMDQTNGVGLVLAFTDLEGDGRMDFYIGNDGSPADFLSNLGAMRFENIASRAGLAVDMNAAALAAMGADWADFNRDGLLDLVVTNFQWTSFVLFQNMGDNSFMDASQSTGLRGATRNRLGFGAKWVDFENDGWPDIFFVNGHVYDNAADADGLGAEFRQPAQLFRNEQGRRFVDLVPALGPDVQRTMLGRGSATADFDNDGRIDLLAVDFEGPVMLLENRTRTDNHWITLDLRGTAPNGFAYGARVVGKAGTQVWIADVSPASSYLSSSDPRVHWGLGEVIRLDQVVIHWPSGRELTLHDVPADQILRIDEARP
ncbi:MAG: CRTAC1 family protein [Deltaproteobacteria bacterium]